MALDLQNDCTFAGPALPLPFVSLNLEAELNRLRLPPRPTGDDARALGEFWPTYRAHLRQLVSQGGPQRVRNQVIDPLIACPLLGYSSIEAADDVPTREGRENGGAFLVAPDGARLRFWTAALNEDLDAPARRGEAYRFSHIRVASRVLLAAGERLGILTNGAEIRLLICDPARQDSHVSITLDGSWKRAREIPDSFRFFVALARPEGVRALAEIIDKARLQQAKVTKDLRIQARLAVEGFLQAVLDAPENRDPLARHADMAALARDLWREGLVTVYRLLFILKLEATDDPARCFSFASGSLWRNSFSPGVALAPVARAVLDRGEQSGAMLENGLRVLFRMLESGLQCTELNVRPMGGSLFAPQATPILSSLHWPERGVASLLDRLLWTTPRRGLVARERVHYGPLDVEDLGRVYEALLELEPGITTEPMCRLRRAKLEVVVPAAQGERYRPADNAAASTEEDAAQEDDTDEPEDEEESRRGKKTKVEWIEEIPPGRFYLRVGLGRKATGSFYTPHSFVRFLVKETLGPLVERVSPVDDPQPQAILGLKVIDKAMGSGHFLVESCRFLGEALHEAARRCDELGAAAEKLAESYRQSGHNDQAAEQESRAAAFRQRVVALPDPDDELLRYLPSRSVEGQASGFSQKKAEALCKRMVAVHCLYGVDKNPLAVELAKLALWIECHAEGLPLTFLDHRLVVGDSLTGPFFEHLLKYPGSQQPLDDLFTRGLTAKLTAALADALQHVRALEATVGVTVADIEAKQAAKARLDRALAPFKVLAAAWAGGVMLGPEGCDDTAYAALAKHIAGNEDLPEDWLAAFGNHSAVALLKMVAKGLGLPNPPTDWSALQSAVGNPQSAFASALSFDLAFPEVFFPDGNAPNRAGFDADLGNPPWDKMLPADKEFFAAFEFSILNAPTKNERASIQKRLLQNHDIKKLYDDYVGSFRANDNIIETFYRFQVVKVYGERTIGKQDAFRAFMERSFHCLANGGVTGVVVPSAFHANEGATGVRRLYLNQMAQRCCFSFQNKRKLFEIHAQFKFATVIAERGKTTSSFLCAFYLQDDEWLFSEQRQPPPLEYSLGFVQRTGGEYLSLLELRTLDSFKVAEVCYQRSETFGAVCERLGIQLGRELNMTDDAWRFTDTESILGEGVDPREPTIFADVVNRGYLLIAEGKSFWQFEDRWSDEVRSLVSLEKLGDKPNWLTNAKYFRLAYRAIQNAENERTLTLMLLPPGRLFGNSANCDRRPQEYANWRRLYLQAATSSFPADWLLRLKTTANVNLFILNELAFPRGLDSAAKFLAHSALRLTCNHAGYAPLWREQVGEEWREAGPAFTWPVLAGDDARWAVRAAIDAVVAQAYGLTRDQYAHVLSTFSHASYKAAPGLCLAAFDELQQVGLDVFTRRHDPYHDIPLNENLPQPVIDLPLPAAAVREDSPAYGSPDLFGTLTQNAPRRSRRRRTT